MEDNIKIVILLFVCSRVEAVRPTLVPLLDNRNRICRVP